MKTMMIKTIHPVKARGYSAVGWAVNATAQLVKARRRMKTMMIKTIHPVKVRGYSTVGWAVNAIAQLVKARRDD